MKKTIIFTFVLSLVTFCQLKSQNTYDTYNTYCGEYPAVDPDDPSTLFYSSPTAGYLGEYQIFLNNHPWTTSPALNANAISYKIEAVSFPFTPNCVYCQTFFGATTDRVLRMPSEQFPYDPAQNSWVRNTTGLSTPPVGNTNDYLLRREFTGQYADPSVSASGISGNTHYATLASAGIPRHSITPLAEYHSERVFYPHTILKHSFYMHCGNNITDPIIDSMVFIIDHTRGKMSEYPFISTNSNTTFLEHDVTISLDWYTPITGSTLNTIEYFPFLKPPSVCSSHIPTDGSSVWNEQDFIRPHPQTLLHYFLGNNAGSAAVGYNPTFANEQDGIKHDYIIDRTFDLNILNPSEKIIYNPSDVAIDLNQPYNTTLASRTLTFPSGYTFKTVSGLYPTPAQVYAGDPDRLYNDPQKIPYSTTLTCDASGNPSGTVFSYYRIKTGSTLNIEACVGLYDVTIVVENGGVLNYDPTKVHGNYNLIQDVGSTVNILSLSNVPCEFDCYDITKYDVKDIIISSATLWAPIPMTSHPYDYNNDGKITIAGNLTILANQTLTINGSQVYEFGENAGITIQRGARLIVNGATFTSADICKQGMWRGIEVWGDPSVSQGGAIGAASQGHAIISNATIMNARNAISTRNGNDTWNFNGGLIQCTNVVFLNNRTSVGFLSYKNKPTPTTELKNFSYLRDCQFLTTDYLKDPIYSTADGRRLGNIAQVTMYEVKDVTIENCLFENSAIKSDGSPLFDTDLRGSGIYSIDSDIRLRGGAYANEFIGYSDALWALNTPGKSDFVWISGTLFKNNVHSLTLEAVKSPRIELNVFEIPAHEPNSFVLHTPFQKGYKKPVGLYLISSTDFIAQENKFKSYGVIADSSTPIDEYNYGMVVNNCSGSTPAAGSGSGIGYAYKNFFSNLNVNLQSELDNKGGFDLLGGVGGLEYKCNEFNTRINFDVNLPDAPGGVASLIRNQGLCVSIDPQKQAGNIYYPCISSISSEELNFGAISLVDNPDFLYQDHSSTMPTCTNNTTILCTGTPSANSCPSNFSICSTIPCLTTLYTSSSLAAKEILDAYKLLLDGGNTSYLLNQINSSLPAGQLKNLLLSKSPYLSDTVLVGTLTRSDLPPYGHLEQIMLANSPLSISVVQALENVGLPVGILNNIMSAQSGVSARKQKENEIDYYAFQTKLAAVSLKQEYLKSENMDSVKIVLQNDTTLTGLFNTLELLIDMEEYVEAQIYLSRIQAIEGAVYKFNQKIINLMQIFLQIMILSKVGFS